MSAFWKHALSVKEVLAAYQVTGDKDSLVHLAVRDMDRLRDTAVDAFASRPEVTKIETSIIFEQTETTALPCLLPSRK